MDGNISIDESENLSAPSSPQLPDKITIAGHLPAVATYNFRSLFPKLRNVKNDILERGVSLALCSEIWEKSEKREHKFEIENML